MTDSKNGSKSNLNESNMPLLSEEAAEKGGDTPEKEVIEMTETEKVRSRSFGPYHPCILQNQWFSNGVPRNLRFPKKSFRVTANI